MRTNSKNGPVKSAGAGAGEDVGESRSAAADLGGHPTGAGIDAFDRIDVEVREGRTAHLGIADVGAVHGKGSFNAALPVDGELCGEVGGAVGVGHGSGGQQQQRTEVALVQRQFADGLAGKLFAAGRSLFLLLERGDGDFAAAREREHHSGTGSREHDGLSEPDFAVVGLDGEMVLPDGQWCQAKLAIRAGDRFGCGALGSQFNLCPGNRGAPCVVKYALPLRLPSRLCCCCYAHQR